MLHLVVSLEPDLAQKVEPEKGECHNPDGEVYFPVENAPVVGLVGNAEELESEGNLNESQNHLDGVEPSSALWKILQQAWHKGKYCEWQGKCSGEGEHCYDWLPNFALCALY